MGGAVEKWNEIHVTLRVSAIMCVLVGLLSFCVFIVAFLFENSELAQRVDNTWGSEDIDPVMVILRNCALAGSLSCLLSIPLGIVGVPLKNRLLLIFFTITCWCTVIILIVCAIVPAVTATALSIICSAVSSCYRCDESKSTTQCNSESDTTCWVYQEDYHAVCTDMTGKLWFVVTAFAFLFVMQCMNGCLSCSGILSLSRSKRETTNTVVIQQGQVAPGPVMVVQQPYPAQQPYPVQQPYPQQPYPQQPYPQQPYPQEAPPYVPPEGENHKSVE